MHRLGAIWLAMLMWSSMVAAQDVPMQYNTYGAPGLIDMPIASSAPDAELAFSTSSFAGQTRNTLTFQVSPRLSASFRYADLDDVRGQRDVLYDTILDRSLALHYRFVDETGHRPALAIGVNDFVGTGIYSGEYVVATKTLHPDVMATLGIGWGRLAGVGGFDGPFGARPDPDIGEGGTVGSRPFFQGNAALFGGMHWQASDRVGLALEYSSDAYPYEDGPAFDRQIPINVGLTYAPRPDLRLSARYLHGAELGMQLTYVVNPLHPPAGSGFDPAPPPVRPRAVRSHLLQTSDSRLADALAAEGLILHAVSRTGPVLSIEIENKRYAAGAQAVGRTARVLSRIAPADVTHLRIALTDSGMASSVVDIPRASLELAEFALDGADQIRRASEIKPHFDRPVAASRFPVFDWEIGPYITPNLFDPDDPLRADIGVAVDAQMRLATGVVAMGTLRQRLAGNLDQATRVSDSVLPRVRSDFRLYDQEGDADLVDLTLGWYTQPSPEVTTRLSAGLFETMFAGASAEVLWRPHDSDFAFGLELNALRQRDYDGGFGLLDYQVNTGHASVYWQIGQGYAAQVDAGRYLAGDWGATLHLSRQFANGWSLGAFTTFTDVSFEDFGEGSFDKGISITVPLSWISGEARRDTLDATVRPVTRDGGARVMIEGRLYELTQPLTAEAINNSWGRFWR